MREPATQTPVLVRHDAPSEAPAGAPDTPFRPFDEEPQPEPVDASGGDDERREEEGEAALETADRSDVPPFAEPLDEDEDEDELEVTTLDGGAEERAPRARHSRGEDEGEAIEQVGGDAMEEMPRRAPRLRRQYKIQEVIKRRQVLLVQVVKEERGNKGAALTTYLSLAGRYSVLMPNTARGGGISRKITNTLDRSRLKSIAQDLEVPEGMGVILRTAGASRTKAEVKRDFEYLLRMWETVRELTLSSSAPTLVYEEGSLIKRAIRDLYDKDVEEVIVAGEEGYREAKEFMRLLMPSHAKNVQPYRDLQPVFARAGVEAQLDAMFSNQVTLKSGGYIVINQTEALVAIDVNSGRSTREHNIEDTALRTNLEAADEIARQLRLRDLAGLIVLDLIDMEEARNNRAVERRLKDALKNDRARIQVGRISHFGLLEMSRQRIRTGVLEGSTVVCPHCMGAGVVRSTASIALHVLRVLEDALIKSASHNMTVRTRAEVALYILNQKRRHLRDLERRFGVTIMVAADETLTGLAYHAFERGEPATGVTADETAPGDFAIYDDSVPADEEFEEEVPVEGEAELEREETETVDAAEDEAEARAARQDARSGNPARARRARRFAGVAGAVAGAASAGRPRVSTRTPRNRLTRVWPLWPRSAAICRRLRATPEEPAEAAEHGEDGRAPRGFGPPSARPRTAPWPITSASGSGARKARARRRAKSNRRSARRSLLLRRALRASAARRLTRATPTSRPPRRRAVSPREGRRIFRPRRSMSRWPMGRCSMKSEAAQSPSARRYPSACLRDGRIAL